MSTGDLRTKRRVVVGDRRPHATPKAHWRLEVRVEEEVLAGGVVHGQPLVGATVIVDGAGGGTRKNVSTTRPAHFRRIGRGSHRIEVRHPDLAWGRRTVTVEKSRTTVRVRLHRMEIATQDEGALTRTPDAGRRALLLDRSRSLGAKWVRVNLYWGKDDVDAAHLGVILGAVAAIKAAGFEVQATLTGGSEDWTGGRGVEPSPAAFASFVASVVPALSAAGVWRYSIWNEPNHPAFLAAGPHARSYVAKVARAKALGAAAATQTGATKRETLREAKALSHAASAIFARKIFAANARLYSKLYAGGYRAVKAAQPGAQVLFGELSTFRALEFLERAIRGRRLRADGFALHPYQYRVAPEKRDGDTGGGIGNIDRIAQKLEELAHARALRDATGHPVKLFLTEFGYHRLEYGDGSGVHRAQTSDKRLVPERKRALWTPRAFERARRFGAAEMLVYHLYPCDVRGTLPVAWDSSVLDFDGSPTASYQSLQAWARKHHYPGVP